MEAADPERLVDVDVAEPRDPALIEQRGLQRRSPAIELSPEADRRQRAERLWPEARFEIRPKVAVLEELPRPEATDITVSDVRSIV